MLSEHGGGAASSGPMVPLRLPRPPADHVERVQAVRHRRLRQGQHVENLVDGLVHVALAVTHPVCEQQRHQGAVLDARTATLGHRLQQLGQLSQTVERGCGDFDAHAVTTPQGSCCQ